MSRIALPRRSLLASAAGAWFAVPRGGSASPARAAALCAFCAHLDCPRSLGEACLRALPGKEAESRFLTRALFSDLPPAASRANSARALAAMVRERSRKDFVEDRIAIVDGWMLSLTETRLFAAATLFARERGKSG